MTALEQVAALKAQAVELLLAERARIDEQLAILQENAPAKKRGRKPNHQQEPTSGHSDMNRKSDPSPSSSPSSEPLHQG